ncbi:unnamed protein product [Protopolystoma xenopodis]|uniref:Uncharacterized protein n=1 Tax=Protopolystoma xenopodis TaxID=117903 RepID=A0A3S5FF65_9PLAT|nr:unnamed protein product [Protopolystoma xenopodis]
MAGERKADRKTVLARKQGRKLRAAEFRLLLYRIGRLNAWSEKVFFLFVGIKRNIHGERGRMVDGETETEPTRRGLGSKGMKVTGDNIEEEEEGEHM